MEDNNRICTSKRSGTLSLVQMAMNQIHSRNRELCEMSFPFHMAIISASKFKAGQPTFRAVARHERLYLLSCGKIVHGLCTSQCLIFSAKLGNLAETC